MYGGGSWLSQGMYTQSDADSPPYPWWRSYIAAAQLIFRGHFDVCGVLTDMEWRVADDDVFGTKCSVDSTKQRGQAP